MLSMKAHTTPGLVARSVELVVPVAVEPPPPVELVLLPAAFDPARNDAILWGDGSHGVVLQTADTWMDPGEIYACVDASQVHVLTAEKRIISAEQLEATHGTFQGRRVLKYVGQ